METVNIKALTNKINSISRRSKTLRDDIQIAGIMAMQAVFEETRNGDTVFLTRLANAMGQGANCASFVRWLEAYTPAFKKPAKPGTKDTFTIDGTQYVLGLNKGWNDLVIVDIIENLSANAWYDMEKPAKVDKDFNFDEALAALYTKAGKMQEEKRLVNATKLKQVGVILAQDEAQKAA